MTQVKAIVKFTYTGNLALYNYERTTIEKLLNQKIEFGSQKTQKRNMLLQEDTTPDNLFEDVVVDHNIITFSKEKVLVIYIREKDLFRSNWITYCFKYNDSVNIEAEKKRFLKDIKVEIYKKV